MQPTVSSSTKALSPDCGMIAGVLRDLQEDGEAIKATFGHTCPHCGCPAARTAIMLPVGLLSELQPLVGKACRICRDMDRYLIREESP
jgi:hypothetical protein